MKQITVISGKGGTGKTTLSANFAVLQKNTVVADCDVDAPDLHLLLKPKIINQYDFVEGQKYSINKFKCSKCDICRKKCEFNAISLINSEYKIDEFLCEACDLCLNLCPEKAIEKNKYKSGEWYTSSTEFGDMTHAKLFPGEENSGKLVNTVRKQAILTAEKNKNGIIIIDGPPGKGCPVISAITDVDAVLLVTEPTPSGINDFIGVFELIKYFNIKTFACVNKADINMERTQEIKNFCKKNDIEYTEDIFFDNIINKSLQLGIPVIQYTENKTTETITKIWTKIYNFLINEE